MKTTAPLVAACLLFATLPALVQEIVHDALRHRVGLTYEAEAEGLSTDKILDQVLIRTPVPAKA